jgi:hypothetical protein
MFDDLILQIESKYTKNEIKDSWINWYIYENDWGNRKYTAGYDDKTTVIKNTKDLWKLIQKGVEK